VKQEIGKSVGRKEFESKVGGEERMNEHSFYRERGSRSFFFFFLLNHYVGL
jgi:hypothetical protein